MKKLIFIFLLWLIITGCCKSKLRCSYQTSDEWKKYFGDDNLARITYKNSCSINDLTNAMTQMMYWIREVEARQLRKENDGD